MRCKQCQKELLFKDLAASKGMCNSCYGLYKDVDTAEYSKTDEILHHIEEGKKLLEQGRFTIQEYREKMSFLMGDLWLVMERLDSVKKLYMEEEDE